MATATIGYAEATFDERVFAEVSLREVSFAEATLADGILADATFAEASFLAGLFAAGVAPSWPALRFSFATLALLVVCKVLINDFFWMDMLGSLFDVRF